MSSCSGVVTPPFSKHAVYCPTPILRNVIVLGNFSNDSRQETIKYMDGLLSFTVKSLSLWRQICEYTRSLISTKQQTDMHTEKQDTESQNLFKCLVLFWDRVSPFSSPWLVWNSVCRQGCLKYRDRLPLFPCARIILFWTGFLYIVLAVQELTM